MKDRTNPLLPSEIIALEMVKIHIMKYKDEKMDYAIKRAWEYTEKFLETSAIYNDIQEQNSEEQPEKLQHFCDECGHGLKETDQVCPGCKKSFVSWHNPKIEQKMSCADCVNYKIDCDSFISPESVHPCESRQPKTEQEPAEWKPIRPGISYEQWQFEENVNKGIQQNRDRIKELEKRIQELEK